MNISVVLVGTEYPVNLGMVARLCKNFSANELILVKPEVEKSDEIAKMYAKHAIDVLENAKVYNSLEEIKNKYELMIATTGVINRFRGTFKTYYTLQDFVKLKHNATKVAFVFGREGIGLTEDEIDVCDFIVNIPASKDYPVLNLANSVAIILYATYNYKPKKIKLLDGKEKNVLYEYFDFFVDYVNKENKLRNPKKVKIAFKRIFSTNFVPEKEAKAIIGIFRRLKEELEKNDKK
ncbi:MAG: TrmH family RNA methyltransferase [Candidatus Anstonellales archaeon]